MSRVWRLLITQRSHQDNMAGSRKRAFNRTGQPNCLICYRAIKSDSDRDPIHEQAHKSCAHERRERQRKEASKPPSFKTLEEQHAYEREIAKKWNFLYVPW
jgi:hypothetical protein